MRNFLPAVVVAFLALAASRASADGQAIDPAQARAHFAEGQRRYEAGDFAGALGYFQDARRVSPAPELDYDVGRCWDQLGRVDEAILEYRRYVSEAPNAVNAPAVKARLVLLERERGGTPSAVEPATRTAATTASTSPSRRWWLAPALVGGSALAVAVVGAALVGSVDPDYQRLRASCDHACLPSRWSGLEARANAGYALWGVAGALAVADAVWWTIAARRHQRESRVALGASTLRLRF